MPLLALLRPGYFATPTGHFLLIAHEAAIVFLVTLTVASGAIYEWYASELVAACKPPPGAPPPAFGAAAEAGAAADAGAGAAAGGGGGGGAGALAGGDGAALPVGTLARRARSTPCRVLATGVSASRAAGYLLSLLPWLWAPITAVLYLLGPSAVAQTMLIFYNRQRKAHVSPKAAPTPTSTPRPGATPTLLAAPDSAPSPLATPARGGAGAGAGGDEGSGGGGFGVGGAGGAAAAVARPQPVRLTLPAAAYAGGFASGATVTRRGEGLATQ